MLLVWGTISFTSSMPSQQFWKQTLAARSRRFGAFILDALPCMFLSYGMRYIDSVTYLVVANVILLQMIWLYSFFMHGKYGQTLGKMRHGIEVVNATYGTPAGYGRAFLRALPLFICCMVFSIVSIHSLLNQTFQIPENSGISMSAYVIFNLTSYVFIGWLMVNALVLIFHPRRRSLADLISGTSVVLKRNLRAPKAENAT